MNIKKKKLIKKAMITGAILGAAAGILLTFLAAKKVVNSERTKLTSQIKTLKKEKDELSNIVEQTEKINAAATLSTKAPKNWELVLVGNEYPLDEKYKPKLTEIAQERYVDSRIAEDTKRMLKEGEEAGMKFYIVSAYRSIDDQKKVFNDDMQIRINAGDSYVDAYNNTRKSISVPNCSEHSLGLSLDIVSADYDTLDDAQADTKEAKWLAENAYKYGFILRYPKGKEDITHITFEPWHFRYVGKDAAEKITKKNITLEEYLGVK